ncbi:MAG: thymidine phosphorylase [Rhodobacteraceae bacterium]|nr:thymidine phosphorylase [Paracoccaceae bacterium]
MDARAILARLRDGATLSRDELTWFARGLASGEVSDAQAGAFAMAAVLNGLGPEGRVALTLAMRDTGEVMRWSLPGPVIDKHSTGGIGDSVSLILAPALAALGAYVPMVSGRGLGHTGGTLDKLESIPGLGTELDEARFHQVVGEVGCAIVSASDRVAPADKRLYAIRDVTSTVESIDLITASILSKKLAAGLQGLVLDVKVGSGAFMARMEDALALAESLVSTANGAGCATSALITDMNQPCISSLGNALEVMEVMEVLTGGDASSRIAELSCALGGELMVLANMAETRDEGAAQLAEVIRDGSAADRFGRMIAAQGGPGDFVEHWADRLPAAPVVLDVTADRTGFVSAMNGRALGEAVVHLGGGRLVGGQRIDPSVGLSRVAALGEPVQPGEPLARVHAANLAAGEAAAQTVREAIVIGEVAPEVPPLIHRSVLP